MVRPRDSRYPETISILAYVLLDEAEAKTFRPRIVLVDRENRIVPV